MIEDVLDNLLIPVLLAPLHASSCLLGQIIGNPSQGVGILTTRAPPNTQTRIAFQKAKGPDQIMYALGRDMRSDVPEGEWFTFHTLSPTEARSVEAVVQVDQLLFRQAKVVLEPVTKVAGRRNKHVHQSRHFTHMTHPSGHPASPVADVVFSLLRRSAEVPGIATLRTFPVLLTITDGPQGLPISREHLHELTTWAHQPVIMKREDDGHVS